MNGRTKVPDPTAEQQPAKGQRKDMRRKNKKIDMLNGSIWDKMIVFALPLAFTGMLQQLFNAADVAVLGRFVSNESMAGVGNNVPVIGLIIAFCMGLALGANVVVARLLGMKEPERANRAVHTALATAELGLVSAIPILLLHCAVKTKRDALFSHLEEAASTLAVREAAGCCGACRRDE